MSDGLRFVNHLFAFERLSSGTRQSSGRYQSDRNGKLTST